MLPAGRETICLIGAWCVVALCAQVLIFLGVLWGAAAPASTSIFMAGENTQRPDGNRGALLTRSMRWVLAPALAALAAAGIAWMYSTPRKIVLRAKRDLKPFTAVRPADVDEISTDVPHAKAVTKEKFVYGQITAVAVPRNRVFRESDLLSIEGLPEDMNDWRLYATESASPPPTAGEKVILYGIKEKAEAPVTITEEALALGMTGEKVVVAVSPAYAKAASEYIVPERRLLIVRAFKQEPKGQ